MHTTSHRHHLEVEMSVVFNVRDCKKLFSLISFCYAYLLHCWSVVCMGLGIILQTGLADIWIQALNLGRIHPGIAGSPNESWLRNQQSQETPSPQYFVKVDALSSANIIVSIFRSKSFFWSKNRCLNPDILTKNFWVTFFESFWKTFHNIICPKWLFLRDRSTHPYGFIIYFQGTFFVDCVLSRKLL